MNPLRPSLTLLRKIARLLAESEDSEIREWVDELSRRHSSVSVVKTYRAGRLCGYEVWRHLKSSIDDPKRRKARLWFGLRPKGVSGQEEEALRRAKRAAKWLGAMSERELHAWWEDQQRQRRESVRGVVSYKKSGNVVIGWTAQRIVDGQQITLRFGVSRWQKQRGYPGAARDMAEKAARKLYEMNKEQLRAWWADHQQRREKLKNARRKNIGLSTGTLADAPIISTVDGIHSAEQLEHTTKKSSPRV